ncbi:hypothetical protein NHX12_009905 [Muraenolepis orangiensis]|uniref:Uncharacterized protein n=1 Tax=Muraenolepis orangiensis TaxID=630683 RepID=A0A9Q0DIR4_9TELE|nr:hypothetical protein NHX12_009905 [Muraenolepis orangiensis]
MAANGLDGVGVFACQGGAASAGGGQENGTCVTHLNNLREIAFPPLSSTLALVVLVALIVGIVLVSMATFHLHKRKLRQRKIRRAQEEYERDSSLHHPHEGGAREHPRNKKHPHPPPQPRATVIVRPASPPRHPPSSSSLIHPPRPVHEHEHEHEPLDTSPRALRLDSSGGGGGGDELREHGGEDHCTLHAVVVSSSSSS